MNPAVWGRPLLERGCYTRRQVVGSFTCWTGASVLRSWAATCPCGWTSMPWYMWRYAANELADHTADRHRDGLDVPPPPRRPKDRP